jgi:hypothetical protein
MCVELESINHLLFQCPFASFVWSLLASVAGWPAGPLSVLDLLAISKQEDGANFDFVWVGASAVLWALWNIRNKLIFEGKILKQPTDAFFTIFSFLQSWRSLWPDNLLKVIDWIVKRCKKKTKRFRRLSHIILLFLGVLGGVFGSHVAEETCSWRAVAC